MRTRRWGNSRVALQAQQESCARLLRRHVTHECQTTRDVRDRKARVGRSPVAPPAFRVPLPPPTHSAITSPHHTAPQLSAAEMLAHTNTHNTHLNTIRTMPALGAAKRAHYFFSSLKFKPFSQTSLTPLRVNSHLLRTASTLLHHPPRLLLKCPTQNSLRKLPVRAVLLSLSRISYLLYRTIAPSSQVQNIMRTPRTCNARCYTPIICASRAIILLSAANLSHNPFRALRLAVFT